MYHLRQRNKEEKRAEAYQEIIESWAESPTSWDYIYLSIYSIKSIRSIAYIRLWHKDQPLNAKRFYCNIRRSHKNRKGYI